MPVLTGRQIGEIKRIFRADTHASAKLFYLAAVTGARLAEVMALTPHDVGSA